jgi:ABC-2 type transport system permease protein
MRFTRKALSVARWEFVERVKTKSFIIGVFLTPVIILVFAIAPAALRGVLGKKEQVRLVLYDGSAALQDSIESSLDRLFTLPNGTPLYAISRMRGSGGMALAGRQVDSLILAGRVDAAMLIPSTVFDSLDFEYRSRNVADIENAVLLEQSVSDVVTSHRLAKAGLDPRKVRELNRHAVMRTVRVSEQGARESGFLEAFGMSYVFLIMLMIMILSSGQILVRSLVEEKSNRIVEVLVSSCSAMDLMFGKIFGLSLLGLVQAGIWAIASIAIVLVTGVQGLPMENLWLMTIYFFLGFFLYTALFVAMGSLVSTEQEAQQMTGYLSMFLSLPLVAAVIVTQNPNSPVLSTLSLIPFLTPSLMLIRIPVLMPPVWEIIATLAILALSIFALVWIAAKIFRIGILLTGKRPSLKEIVRWIKA